MVRLPCNLDPSTQSSDSGRGRVAGVEGIGGHGLNGYDSPEGTYLFDDGTIGMIGEPDFDIDDYLDDGEDPDDLEVRGMEPVGNIYIDRWKPGRFYDGGLYLYYKGETLRDYCKRNGEPLPMRRLPDDVYDLIRDGEWDELKRYYDEVPELKRMVERV